MAVIKDLGKYCPVFRDGQIVNETRYWKRFLLAGASLDDRYEMFSGVSMDDGNVAATADIISVAVAPYDCIARAAYVVFTAAGVTGADTNYATVSLTNRATGSGTDVVATKAFTNGVDATQYAPTVLTLHATEANLQISAGEVITGDLTKTGDGLAVNEADVFLVVEPMYSLANDISMEAVICVAPHRMQVLAAYAVFKEGAVTGAATNYPEIDIINKGTDGSGTTEVAEEAFTSGVDAVQHDDTALTVSSTQANTIIERGEVLTARLLKHGSGMQVRGVDVFIIAKAIE